MKEQVKITFLIDKEEMKQINRNNLKNDDDKLDGFVIMMISSLLSKGNEEFNTINVSEAKDEDLKLAFIKLCSILKSEAIGDKDEGYLDSIFGKGNK